MSLPPYHSPRAKWPATADRGTSPDKEYERHLSISEPAFDSGLNRQIPASVKLGFSEQRGFQRGVVA